MRAKPSAELDDSSSRMRTSGSGGLTMRYLIMDITGYRITRSFTPTAERNPNPSKVAAFR